MEGYFKATSDRATFFPVRGIGGYLGLENLMLERVVTVIGENPDRLPKWIVSAAP